MKALLILLLGFSAYGQVPSYVPTTDLVAWYHFNPNKIKAGFGFKF